MDPDLIRIHRIWIQALQKDLTLRTGTGNPIATSVLSSHPDEKKTNVCAKGKPVTKLDVKTVLQKYHMN